MNEINFITASAGTIFTIGVFIIIIFLIKMIKTLNEKIDTLTENANTKTEGIINTINEINTKMESSFIRLIDVNSNITSKIDILNSSFDSQKKSIENNLASLNNNISAMDVNIQSLQISTEIKIMQFMNSIMQKENAMDITNSHWILEGNDVKKHFIPGRIEKVEMNNENIEMIYEYLEDNTILCSTTDNGYLKSKVILSKFGAPVKGEIYDETGALQSTYFYDQLGQLSEIKN